TNRLGQTEYELLGTIISRVQDPRSDIELHSLPTIPKLFRQTVLDLEITDVTTQAIEYSIGIKLASTPEYIRRLLWGIHARRLEPSRSSGDAWPHVEPVVPPKKDEQKEGHGVQEQQKCLQEQQKLLQVEQRVLQDEQ